MVQKLTGLVLRTTEYKESDLILNILTREQGLISAKARAVRTNQSHNKGACQLLCYSEFTITDYKGFSAISEANAIEMFPELRSDIELLSLASYFAQAAEVLSQEDAGSGEVLSLTLNALYALAKLRKPQDLVKAAFELRLACIGGYEPDLTGCAVCGPGGLRALSGVWRLPAMSGVRAWRGAEPAGERRVSGPRCGISRAAMRSGFFRFRSTARPARNWPTRRRRIS